MSSFSISISSCSPKEPFHFTLYFFNFRIFSQKELKKSFSFIRGGGAKAQNVENLYPNRANFENENHPKHKFYWHL